MSRKKIPMQALNFRDENWLQSLRSNRKKLGPLTLSKRNAAASFNSVAFLGFYGWQLNILWKNEWKVTCLHVSNFVISPCCRP